ncbi:hypothetical protein DEDE109153_06880 [Deinococcus deserti]|uniref:Adhesin domain-containing protein n=1 Tax=Deinococcus deserti (strain DSM 17065 / CIP 109153 / LMG 22923 / VCD115) TaxID=546414 RepID=C1D046_DEIDV|nr:hypothetical protein [Deinococcus deserti]ACO47315.1 hypothetical protein Deide_22830 [Deinococcus deserti VCD115]
MSEQHSSEEFRAQVQRLVAEGKLTPEEAQGLLEGFDQPDTRSMDAVYTASGDGNTPPDLRLSIQGFALQVVQDAAQVSPQLHVSEDGRVFLEATSQGWHVARRPGQSHNNWHNVRAVLTVPFTPRHVVAEVHGGHLSLPDVSGDMQANVHGGNVRMGQALSLQAEVHGGHLSATEIGGPTRLNVNGGNLSLTGAASLNASVNGGNLKWAGVLGEGTHRLEVNAGNATLHLDPGSNLRVDAEVTMGAFKADFPTHKQGSFVTTRHSGQLGTGTGSLSCRVAAGQVKLVTR